MGRVTLSETDIRERRADGWNTETFVAFQQLADEGFPVTSVTSDSPMWTVDLADGQRYTAESLDRVLEIVRHGN